MQVTGKILLLWSFPSLKLRKDNNIFAGKNLVSEQTNEGEKTTEETGGPQGKRCELS